MASVQIIYSILVHVYLNIRMRLIKAFKNTLPNFFGFEDVGVLIRDMKTDLLFTLNEIKNDEHDDWMRVHALHYDKKNCLKEPMRDV